MNRTSLLYLTAEVGPVLAFFIAGRLTDFYGAATVLLITTALACLLSWHTARHVPVIPLVSGLFVMSSALLTIHFHEPDILIFADTMFYATFAGAFAWSLWRHTLLLKKLFGSIFAMTDNGWFVLTRNWLFFTLAAAIANEFVRQTATPDFWIDYRFYKTLFMLSFALSQLYVSAHYRVPEVSNRLGIRTTPLDN